MKKYISLVLLSFSFSLFAAENAPQLGQVDASTNPDSCEAPQVKACGPCYRNCKAHHMGDRGGKDVNRAVSSEKGNKGSSSTKQ